jgi:ion channel-forming bestrophin family protein
MPLLSYFKTPKNIQSLTGKKSKSLRSWKQKFHDHTGQKQNSFQLAFLLQGSVVSTIIPWVSFFSGYSLFVTLLQDWMKYINSPQLDNNGGITHIIVSSNLLLSLLLIFRTNAAYQRYWEGRKLWGILVNTIRNLARGISIIIEEHSTDNKLAKEANIKLTVAFAFALKSHLRSESINKELMPLMSYSNYSKLKNVEHLPLKIVFWIGDYLQEQYRHNLVNLYQLNTLHKLVDNLVDVLGGCERIVKTPTPLIYSIFLKQVLVIYCLILPLELVVHFNWWTTLVMAFFSFLLFGIEEIASELENPFGSDPNDLPLDVICNTIFRNVEELIKSNENCNR